MAIIKPPRGGPPPIESGDRLSQAEFHRRYEACPQVRAELIEGVVYVSSPVRADGHGAEHALAMGWLAAFAAAHPELQLLDNATVILDGANEVQPDACLRRRAGGSSRINREGYVEGPPEFVLEVAGSSASIDTSAKKAAFERAGVREYLVWRVFDGAVDWWELRDGSFVAIAAESDGIIRSRAFPGLRLGVAALLAGDLAAVLAIQASA